MQTLLHSSPINVSGPGLLGRRVKATALPCGHHLFGRAGGARAYAPGPFPLGSPFPAEHPAFLVQGGRATFLPAWRAPRLAGPQATLRSRASRGGARRPHPSPGAGRAASGAHARPPPLPAGGAVPPAAPPSRGGSRRGSGRRAADLLRLRAAPLSSEGGSSSRGGRSSSGEARRQARLSSAPSTPTWSPRAAAPPPGLAARHGFLPGAGARILSLPAGGC